MTCTYYIDTSLECVFSRHIGDFVPGEAADMILSLFDDPAYKKGYNILRDSSRVELPEEHSFKFFKEAGRQQQDRIAGRLGDCRIAWVVGSAKDYAKAHQWALTRRLSTNISRQAFRDIKKARAWLDIPNDYEIKYPTPK